jgi:excisionase family DNA binding protein
MKDPMSGSPWLNAREAAQYLRVDARTLLRWNREGKVRGYALSGTARRVWRFRREDLDATLCLPAVPQNERGMIQ